MNTPEISKPEISELATNKPDLPLTSHPFWDYDLVDRVARALEHSLLHVVGASVVMSVPESAREVYLADLFGDAPPPRYDAVSSLQVELVFVSDGAHGWLALVGSSDDYDAEAELSSFMAEMLSDQPEVACVVRAASDFGDAPEGALDLTEPATRRAKIEAEYDRLLGNSAATPAGELFARFRANGYWLRGEAEIREAMNESPEEPPPAPRPAPAKPEDEAARPRAPRRGIGSRRARRRRSRRPRRP